MDRVPLEQVTEKDESKNEVREGSKGDVGDDKGITEMRDMKALQTILGFENGFDGLGDKAMELYNWAKGVTKADGPQNILMIKNIIQSTGMKEKGKELLIKIHRWAMLQTDIKRIRMYQSTLEN